MWIEACDLMSQLGSAWLMYKYVINFLYEIYIHVAVLGPIAGEVTGRNCLMRLVVVSVRQINEQHSQSHARRPSWVIRQQTTSYVCLTFNPHKGAEARRHKASQK